MPASYLTISNATELRRIQTRHILYISADQNYCNFHLVNGTSFQWTIQLGSLDDIIAKQLEGTDAIFVRIGRSHIINMRYVYHIQPSMQKLELMDNNANIYTLSLSQDALKHLKSALEANL